MRADKWRSVGAPPCTRCGPLLAQMHVRATLEILDVHVYIIHIYVNIAVVQMWVPNRKGKRSARSAFGIWMSTRDDSPLQPPSVPAMEEPPLPSVLWRRQYHCAATCLLKKASERAITPLTRPRSQRFLLRRPMRSGRAESTSE